MNEFIPSCPHPYYAEPEAVLGSEVKGWHRSCSLGTHPTQGQPMEDQPPSGSGVAPGWA